VSPQSANDTQPIVVLLANEMGSNDVHRRDEAFQNMLLIAPPDAVESALSIAAASEDAEIRGWAAMHLEQIDSGL
jgi:hypothetical protein